MSINYNAMYFVVAVVTFAIAICCSKAFALAFFPRLLRVAHTMFVSVALFLFEFHQIN